MPLVTSTTETHAIAFDDYASRRLERFGYPGAVGGKGHLPFCGAVDSIGAGEDGLDRKSVV